MDRVDVSGMIGTPWVEGESHCLMMCADVLDRLGKPEAAESMRQCEPLNHASADWVEATAPYVAGDVVLSRGRNLRLHTSVFYDSSIARVLSSSEEVGAYTCRFSTVKNIISVYRHDLSPGK